MCPPPKPDLTALQLAIAQALQGKSLPPARNALADLFGVPPKSTNNTLAELLFKPATPPPLKASDVFGSSYPGNLGLPSPGALALLGGLPKTRHTFYSFHYADVMRVNQIRMCDQFRTTDRRTPRVVDRSLWETAKKTNPSALARMIDRGLEGTSTTCVLAGTDTWSREWVRYEIARSLQRGNGLLTVFIHNCPCPRNGRSHQGYDPLAQIALGADMRIYEWISYVGFRPYDKIKEKLTSWPKWLPQPAADQVMPLSAGARSYEWVTEAGTKNLIHWTDAAAAAAGK